MSLSNYLKSRVFFAQLITAITIVAILGYLFFHWITFVTHHGEEIRVPNLTKLSEEQMEAKLDELDLDYLIIDTVDYNPKFPKLAVVEQEPTAGSKVKRGMRIDQQHSMARSGQLARNGKTIFEWHRCMPGKP